MLAALHRRMSGWILGWAAGDLAISSSEGWRLHLCLAALKCQESGHSARILEGKIPEWDAEARALFLSLGAAVS